MGDRERFEASQLRHGVLRSALYRTPAGEYEDAEVGRAWQTWKSLSGLTEAKSLAWAESAVRNPAYRY